MGSYSLVCGDLMAACYGIRFQTRRTNRDDVGPDRNVLFDVVHLKRNRREIQQNIPAHETSAKQLFAHANGVKKIYTDAYRHVAVVLAGDLNTSVDERIPIAHRFRLRTLTTFS